MNGKPHPPECRELAYKLKAEGLGPRAIARRIWTLLRVDVSEYTVRGWLK